MKENFKVLYSQCCLNFSIGKLEEVLRVLMLYIWNDWNVLQEGFSFPLFQKKLFHRRFTAHPVFPQASHLCCSCRTKTECFLEGGIIGPCDFGGSH